MPTLAGSARHAGLPPPGINRVPQLLWKYDPKGHQRERSTWHGCLQVWQPGSPSTSRSSICVRVEAAMRKRTSPRSSCLRRGPRPDQPFASGQLVASDKATGKARTALAFPGRGARLLLILVAGPGARTADRQPIGRMTDTHVSLGLRRCRRLTSRGWRLNVRIGQAGIGVDVGSRRGAMYSHAGGSRRPGIGAAG